MLDIQFDKFHKTGDRTWSKKELKFNIEAATRCGGSCDGCVLTEQQRRRSNPRINRRAMDTLGHILRKYAERYCQEYGTINEIAVNLGQGDFFLYPDDDAVFIMEWLQRFFC